NDLDIQSDLGKSYCDIFNNYYKKLNREMNQRKLEESDGLNTTSTSAKSAKIQGSIVDDDQMEKIINHQMIPERTIKSTDYLEVIKKVDAILKKIKNTDQSKFVKHIKRVINENSDDELIEKLDRNPRLFCFKNGCIEFEDHRQYIEFKNKNPKSTKLPFIFRE